MNAWPFMLARCLLPLRLLPRPESSTFLSAMTCFLSRRHFWRNLWQCKTKLSALVVHFRSCAKLQFGFPPEISTGWQTFAWPLRILTPIFGGFLRRHRTWDPELLLKLLPTSG